MRQSQTVLQFWGGLNTIGGNIISIQYENYRIITDFGALAGVNSDILTEEADLADLIDTNKVAAIPALYSRERLGSHSLPSFEESEIKTIICLSHLHLDHLGSFAQLPAEIPVYALEEAVNFYHQLAEQQLLPTYKVNWQAVTPRETITFGPFTITFHPSDHDTLGVAAIFIQTPEIKIIYSGDLRVTGFHADEVYDWALEGRAWEVDVLLLEGTSFSSLGRPVNSVDERLDAIIHRLKAPTETKLMQEIAAMLQQYSDKVFVFNGYPQNMERIYYLGEVAAHQHRQLVLDPRYYALYQYQYGEKTWVQPIGDGGVALENIQANPQHYVVQVDYDAHDFIFDIPAGIYLHSNGVPLGSFDPEYEPFVKKIHEAGWLFVDANVSGHAYPADLIQLAYLIKPKLVVPWHSFQPEVMTAELEKYGLATWLPTYEKEYKELPGLEE